MANPKTNTNDLKCCVHIHSGIAFFRAHHFAQTSVGGANALWTNSVFFVLAMLYKDLQWQTIRHAIYVIYGALYIMSIDLRYLL